MHEKLHHSLRNNNIISNKQHQTKPFLRQHMMEMPLSIPEHNNFTKFKPVPVDSTRSGTAAEEDTVTTATPDGYFADVGFMFDQDDQPTRVETFSWNVKDNNNNNNNSRSLHVELRVVDQSEETEATADHHHHHHQAFVQSGHTLWPAARHMADYMVHQHQHDQLAPPSTVIELGAGCALLSCLALQLWEARLECIVVTDADPGTLERARDNYECTLQTLLDRSVSEEDLNAAINSTASVTFAVQPLTWGNGSDVRAVRGVLGEHSTTKLRRAQLILASELLFCADVVAPLLQTVQQLLASDGVFWLGTTRGHDDADIQRAVAHACVTLGLVRTTVVDEETWHLQEFRLGGDESIRSVDSTDASEGSSR